MQPDTTTHHGHHGKWTTFFAMIATSVATMFAMTYLNSWSADHVYFSQTRVWMALMMGAAMTVIMLGFMWAMYKSLVTKMVVCAAAIAIGLICLVLVRSQATVGDEAWMKAMIPHHSIAVLTSHNAQISDPRVRKLADDIIEAQVREIAEMKMLLADIEANGEAGDGRILAQRRAVLTPAMRSEAQAAIAR